MILRGVSILDTPYKLDHQTRLIQEPDVWRLIIKSRLPEAQKVEKWIFEDVLPQIRKTGSYSIQPEKSKLQELEEIIIFSEIFEKLQNLTKDKSKLELLKLDNFLKLQNRKSILEILQIDFSNLYFSVSELGKFVEKDGSEINQLLEKRNFQTQENGVWQVLEDGREFCFETQNRFSQLKWKFKILEKI